MVSAHSQHKHVAKMNQPALLHQINRVLALLREALLNHFFNDQSNGLRHYDFYDRHIQAAHIKTRLDNLIIKPPSHCPKAGD